jgi:hypothetical protein
MLIRLLCLLTILLAPMSAMAAPAVTAIQGANVQQKVVASNITTNTTTSTSSIMPNGAKSFLGEVVCTSGACTQTQEIRGSANNIAANGILICTITLSGTPRAQDACPVVTAAFPYFYIVTTNTSGTNATGAVYAMY